MRLFLLPISTRRSFLYCQRLNRQLSGEPGLIDKIANKASTTWIKWEEGDKGWQKKVTEYGNRAFQRITYEEWGLKSIPPLSARRKAEELKGKEKVEVLFPAAIIKKENVTAVLRTLATERQALHRRRMWWSVVGIPISLPIGLIPILPNIPFFYLAFRAWSHWRALNGSRHTEFLLDNSLIRPTTLVELDNLYSKRNAIGGDRKDARQSSTGQASVDGSSTEHQEPEERMLLDHSSGRLLARILKAPELAVEVERAVRQVQRVLSARAQLSEEKQEIEAAATRETQKQKQ